MSDSELSPGHRPVRGQRAWSGPAGDQPRTWGPGRVAGGIGALLLTTVFEVGVVSAFDPDLDSLAARLVTQALLAATLVGIAFAVAAGRGGGIASPRALGLRRPLRSPIGMAAAAYLGYIVIALVYSALVHPSRRTSRATSASATGPSGRSRPGC